MSERVTYAPRAGGGRASPDGRSAHPANQPPVDLPPPKAAAGTGVAESTAQVEAAIEAEANPRAGDDAEQRSDRQLDPVGEPGRELLPRQSSIPTSRRRPPLPRRTSSEPRRGSRSASASASASWIRRPGAPQHHDQAAQPAAVHTVTGAAHHRHDLLDRRRIGRVAQPLVARRATRVELRQHGGRTTAAGGIEQHLGHDPPRVGRSPETAPRRERAPAAKPARRA